VRESIRDKTTTVDTEHDPEQKDETLLPELKKIEKEIFIKDRHNLKSFLASMHIASCFIIRFEKFFANSSNFR
jgi:hypothetical protein